MVSPATLNSIGIFLRVLAAAIGGYLLSMVACLWWVQLFDMPEREARMFVNMAFFVVYLLVAIWAFTPRNHSTAVLGIGLTTLTGWILWWAVGGGGA